MLTTDFTGDEIIMKSFMYVVTVNLTCLFLPNTRDTLSISQWVFPQMEGPKIVVWRVLVELQTQSGRKTLFRVKQGNRRRLHAKLSY